MPIRYPQPIALLSRDLASYFDGSIDLVSALRSGQNPRASVDRLLGDLWRLSREDPDVAAAFDRESVAMHEFEELFQLLIANGGGFWANGHFVAVSALCDPATVRVVIDECRSGSALKAVSQVSAYFESGAGGTS